ncbi:unnamed protein product [Gadus morhua 'NCC']
MCVWGGKFMSSLKLGHCKCVDIEGLGEFKYPLVCSSEVLSLYFPPSSLLLYSSLLLSLPLKHTHTLSHTSTLSLSLSLSLPVILYVSLSLPMPVILSLSHEVPRDLQGSQLSTGQAFVHLQSS